MRNLGPSVAKDLAAVEIIYAEQIKKLGPKKTFIKMLGGRKKLGRSTKCCNALYLYSIYGAIYNKDWKEIPKSMKEQCKKFTEELRNSGKFS